MPITLIRAVYDEILSKIETARGQRYNYVTGQTGIYGIEVWGYMIGAAGSNLVTEVVWTPDEFCDITDVYFGRSSDWYNRMVDELGPGKDILGVVHRHIYPLVNLAGRQEIHPAVREARMASPIARDWDFLEPSGNDVAAAYGDLVMVDRAGRMAAYHRVSDQPLHFEVYEPQIVEAPTRLPPRIIGPAEKIGEYIAELIASGEVEELEGIGHVDVSAIAAMARELQERADVEEIMFIRWLVGNISGDVLKLEAIVKTEAEAAGWPVKIRFTFKPSGG